MPEKSLNHGGATLKSEDISDKTGDSLRHGAFALAEMFNVQLFPTHQSSLCQNHLYRHLISCFSLAIFLVSSSSFACLFNTIFFFVCRSSH